MKIKKYKHIEDVIDHYIALQDEQIEIPVLIGKANEKYNQHINEHISYIYKPGETAGMFKIFMQIKKYEERKIQLNTQMAEVENTLKGFLSFLKGGKISYARKEDTEKSRVTFMFWAKDGKIMRNK